MRAAAFSFDYDGFLNCKCPKKLGFDNAHFLSQWEKTFHNLSSCQKHPFNI